MKMSTASGASATERLAARRAVLAGLIGEGCRRQQGQRQSEAHGSQNGTAVDKALHRKFPCG